MASSAAITKRVYSTAYPAYWAEVYCAAPRYARNGQTVTVYVDWAHHGHNWKGYAYLYKAGTWYDGMPPVSTHSAGGSTTKEEYWSGYSGTFALSVQSWGATRVNITAYAAVQAQAGDGPVWSQAGDVYIDVPAASFTVSFHGNGGTPSSASKTVSYGGTYGTLPTATRAGYTFAGWYTAASGGTQVTSSTTVGITANQTLYARWTANSYTVSFDANGGTVSPESKTVTAGETYGELPVPEKTGSTFGGWFTQAEGGTEITAETTVSISANQTLYAHWTGAVYTVSFAAMGGTVSPESKSVTYGAAYGELPVPERAGYGFAGWYTSAGGGERVAADSAVTIAGSHTLYARWEARSILHLVSGGEAATVTEIYTVESGTVSRVQGVYSVENGVVRQGI